MLVLSAYPFRKGKGTSLEGWQREPCIVYYLKKYLRKINNPDYDYSN